MARSRKKKQEAPENHERWLITYADLITLLMVFFVVLYAMSKLDVQKYTVLAQALQAEFKKSTAILDVPNNTGFVPQNDQNDSNSKNNKRSNNDRGQSTDKPGSSKEDHQKREEVLKNLLAQIQKYIKENGLQQQVTAADTERGVVIRLKDIFLFDLGKADLKPQAYPILKKMDDLFTGLDAPISVEGHTDNIKINTSKYPSNWELSTARSLSVLHYFVDSNHLPAKQFSAVGYGEFHPLKPNTTEENRQLNRRVEIVVLRY